MFRGKRVRFLTSSGKFLKEMPVHVGMFQHCNQSIVLLSPDFCNSSNGSSFQPIKAQVTIPTAHVMPSTLGASPSKLCPAGDQSCLQNPSKPAMPGSAASEHTGLMRNGDFNSGKSSQVPPRDLLHLYRTSGENGFEQPWHPVSDHMRAEDTWKFDTPAIERTLNQSLFLDNLCTDPLHRFQKFNPNSGAAEAGKDHYKVLPESKQVVGANGVCEPQDGTWPSGNRLMPTGLPANNFYSKPVSPPSRAWMQDACTLHPHERVCELSAWKQQLDKVRLQVEQMQVRSCLCECMSLKAFLCSHELLFQAYKARGENVCCFSLSYTESLLMIWFYSMWCHRYHLTCCLWRTALYYVTALHNGSDQEGNILSARNCEEKAC